MVYYNMELNLVTRLSEPPEPGHSHLSIYNWNAKLNIS